MESVFTFNSAFRLGQMGCRRITFTVYAARVTDKHLVSLPDLKSQSSMSRKDKSAGRNTFSHTQLQGANFLIAISTVIVYYIST